MSKCLISSVDRKYYLNVVTSCWGKMSNVWLPDRVKDPWDERDRTVQYVEIEGRGMTMAIMRLLWKSPLREGPLGPREVSRNEAADWGRFETVRGKAAGHAKIPERSSVSEGLSPIFPERASGLNGSSEFPSEFAISTRPPSSFLTLQAGHLHQRTIQLLSLIDF